MMTGTSQSGKLICMMTGTSQSGKLICMMTGTSQSGKLRCITVFVLIFTILVTLKFVFKSR
jgi:hypothetical protein